MAKAKITLADIFDRFKAGIIDMFMIMMPIQYFMTYVIAGSARDYRENQLYILISTLLYFSIILLFLFIKTQTPGYKYLNLHLRNKNGKKANFVQIIVRIIVYIISFSLLVGMIFPFFRKDKQFLHDLFSNTIILKEIK